MRRKKKEVKKKKCGIGRLAAFGLSKHAVRRTTSSLHIVCSLLLVPFLLQAEIGQATWIGAAGETNTAWRRKDAERALGVTGVQNHALIRERTLPTNCLRLRKTFRLADALVSRATVSVTGLGFYELWLNGRKVDPTRVMAPAMANPDRCAYYDAYDVAGLLKPGAANTVGLWLAPGYSDECSRFGYMWLAPQRAILSLDVVYADGRTETVLSDGTWSSTTEGPITYASIYHGEKYDAALEDPAWATPAGRTNGWSGACSFPDGPTLRKSEMPPVRMSDPRHPVAIVETAPGVFTADFGQNRAGFVRLRVRGQRGTRIVLQTSELVGPDGKIDPWTNRNARSCDEFVLAGTGEREEYVPRFTYHGFRYVEIRGWPGKPEAEDLEAFAVHADVKRTSTFACSDARLNRIHDAALWSMLSNLMSFPTDCPMRDERVACLMDSQAYEDAACQFFDMRSYYAKWLEDCGSPEKGNPDWTGDVATLPHRLWRFYGDRPRYVARYPVTRRYVDGMLAAHGTGCFTSGYGGFGGYGDWCAPNDGTWKGFFHDAELVNAALFCKILRETSELAALADDAAGAERYARQYDAARTAFQENFYRPNTCSYGDGSQTTAVLPLAFGLVPDDCRDAVARQLLHRIREKDGGRIDTGIYGTRYIGDVLCDLGEVDLLIDLYTQPEYPGFGYMLANGATTLWEQWSCKGRMNSHNHAMFAGGASWLYTHLAGIRPAKPGYAEVLVKPLFPKKLDFLRASRQTPQGEVAVSWKRANGEIELEVRAPADVPTKLELPDGRTLPVEGRVKIAMGDER